MQGRQDYKEYKIDAKQKFLADIPHEPGIYMYLDKNKKVLYVGKAKDLKKRVSSYFIKTDIFPKTRHMLQKAEYVRIITTMSETEAFLLEATLIKLFKPKFNIQLKDDKTYPYLVIQKIFLNSKNASLPNFYYKVFITRNNKLKNAEYFGPFPNVDELKKAYRALRKVFGFANCSKAKFMDHHKKNRPCIYGQIGLCPAPCVDKSGHKKQIINIKRLRQFLKKGQTAYITELLQKMHKASNKQDFEKAIKYRNLIKKLESLAFINVIPQAYVDTPNLTQDIQKSIVNEIINYFGINLDLQQRFISLLNKWEQKYKNKLKLGPKIRVEGYDMSNLQGTNATASLVVSCCGHLEKSEYRRFKIKFTTQTSDFDMMRETFLRRAKHINWPVPNMLLLDGGKLQVGAVLRALAYYIVLELYKNKLVSYSQIKEIGIDLKNKQPVNKSEFKLISKELIVELRKINLTKLFEFLDSQLDKDLAWLYDINTTKSLAQILGFNIYTIFSVPIWGIFKPFDYFVAYIPQLKLSLGDFDKYIKQLNNLKTFAFTITGEWIVLRPKTRDFAIQHLRNLRDESHRFAKTYHKYLRNHI